MLKWHTIAAMGNLNLAMQDAITFSRNNQMLYSSMATQAAALPSENSDGSEQLFKQASAFLERSEAHLETTSRFCIKTLEEYKKLAGH